AAGEERVGAGAHAGQRGEIAFDHLDAERRMRGERLARLLEIARGADDLRTVRGRGACRLDPEPGRNTGDEYASSAEVDASEHVFGSRLGAELLAGHCALPKVCTAFAF